VSKIQNKMKQAKLLTVLLFLLMQPIALKLSAQCPASVTAYIQSQTNATCPSNGMLVIGSNANLVTTAQYQFTVAPPGISLAAQTSNVFTSLLPGNYTVKVSCGASSALVSTTITSTYVQLTGSTAITNTCVNFTKGGRITVTAANGNPPYTYSVLKTTNANYADNLSLYGASNIFNTADSGTFQVRIKDACGNFITKTVIIEPSIAAIKIAPYYVTYDQPCGSGNVSLYFALEDINNTTQNIATIPGGLKFDVYQKGAGCTRGAFIRSEIKTSISYQQLIIPENTSVYVRVTNTCGDTASSCYTKPDAPTNFETYWNTTLTGCATAAAPNGFMNISYDYSKYGTEPIAHSVIKLVGGAIVRNPTVDSTRFNNLPYGEYVVVAVDACGKISKDTIYVPAIGSPAEFSGWTDLECISQTGTLHYRAFIDGFIQDLRHGIVTITSGPTNVGAIGSWVSDLPVIEWFGLVPGTYTASIVTPCDNKNVTFIIEPTSTVLVQSLVVTTTQACNNGGVIYGVLNFNGAGLVYYDLFSSANVLLATNASGNFTGLSAGNYTLKARIELWSNCGIPVYNIAKPITIVPDGTPPVVTKKIGLICEDANGVVTTVGKAIIKHVGFAPFKIEIKKITEPDANYILQTTNSISNYTINGLLPYENYRVRVTDACGNTALTDVAIGKLQELNATNTLGACVGAEYILSAPDLVDASYSWKLNGAVIATTRELVFPTYTNANNGTYECTMIIGGGCVKRVFTSILTGTCGLLPIKVESISATPKDCKIDLVWAIAQEINANKYEIERSRNGNQFEKIGERAAVYNNAGGTYGYQDKAPIAGINYYRLKMIENDGTYTYSKIVTAKSSCDAKDKLVSFYPNPVVNKTVNVSVNSMLGGTVMVNFISLTGQVIQKEKIVLNIGDTYKVIKLQNLSKGVYLVRVTDDNGKEISTQKIMVD
jgi:Secretion system C-terminal sorting domain